MRKPVIVLFDGECNLCNGVVRFLIERDKTGKAFRFAAQQSDAGQKLIAQSGYQTKAGEPIADTLLVFADGKLLTHSNAALELARYLPAPYPALLATKILPKFLRDAAYRFVARNRYRWFGKQDQCLMPTPELKARFL